MQILTNNNIVFQYGVIEVGVFPEADPSRELYKITNGDTVNYVVIADSFKLHKVDTLPDDFEPNKYCYTPEDEFYLNPDWTEPQKSVEERLDRLSADLDYISVMTGVELV